MTTEKQFAANRQNAKKSTGPRSEDGKRRSRRNAFRHGLSAETVLDVVERAADYEALEAAIHADYRPRSNFELELVARLVSLLWRLRRAIAIESGLLNFEAKSSRKRHETRDDHVGPIYALVPTLVPKMTPACSQSVLDGGVTPSPQAIKSRSDSDLAQSFMWLSDRSDVFERLGRYEMRLWRQTLQTILLLNSINHGEKTYIDFGDKNLHVRHRKRHRFLWPPFVTPD